MSAKKGGPVGAPSDGSKRPAQTDAIVTNNSITSGASVQVEDDGDDIISSVLWDGGGFFTLPNALRDWSAAVGGQAVAVYCMVGSHTNSRTREAWPAQARLADLLGFSRSAVADALAALEAFGMIRIRRRRTRGGRFTSSVIALTLPNDWKRSATWTDHNGRTHVHDLDHDSVGDTDDHASHRSTVNDDHASHRSTDHASHRSKNQNHLGSRITPESEAESSSSCVPEPQTTDDDRSDDDDGELPTWGMMIGPEPENTEDEPAGPPDMRLTSPPLGEDYAPADVVGDVEFLAALELIGRAAPEFTDPAEWLLTVDVAKAGLVACHILADKHGHFTSPAGFLRSRVENGYDPTTATQRARELWERTVMDFSGVEEVDDPEALNSRARGLSTFSGHEPEPWIRDDLPEHIRRNLPEWYLQLAAEAEGSA